MAVTRVTRQAVEVLMRTGKVVSLNDIGAEVLAEQDTGSGVVRATRQAAEVLMQAGKVVSLNDIGAEVLAEQDTGTGVTRATRQAVEVLYQPPPRIQLNKIAAEVLTEPDTGTGTVRVVRQAVEVLFPRDVAAPVPIALPSDYEVFLQDWSNGVKLESSYMTDVTSSPNTGAEERRGLRQKPSRSLAVKWLQVNREIVDRLIVNLKRLTNTRVPFPLYCDESIGTANSNSGQTSVWCDTRFRRFFTGGRVLIVPFDSDNFVDSTRISTGKIDTIASDHLVLTTNLSHSFLSGRFSVFPLIDCEIILSPKITFETYEVANVILTVDEVLGANTLPPTRSVVPSDMPLLNGIPILNLNIEQDFTNGIKVAYQRQGDTFGRGRGTVVDPHDPKWQMITDWNMLSVTREAAWKIIEFSDWARGRQRSFYQMDEENLWRAVAIDPIFISIDPLGALADFQADFNFVGIELNDGTVIVREVNTIQLVSGVWKITITGEDLPTIALSDIRRVARARLSRMDSDSFTEEWSNTEVCKFSFSTVEVLDEGEEVL